MDAETRCAVGFLAQEYLTDERFEHAVVARLVSFMMAALRWRPGLLSQHESAYST